MKVSENFYQTIPEQKTSVKLNKEQKKEGFPPILSSALEKNELNSSSSNIQVKDRFRIGYCTLEDKNGRRDWITEQEEIDKEARYYEGSQSPLRILKRLERTGTEVKSNDSSSIWKELREQYDIRNVTFYELQDIVSKLCEAGEISPFDTMGLTLDRDFKRAWRDQLERDIKNGFSVEEILAHGIRMEDIVNSGVSTEKLVKWGIGIEEIEKFKKTEKPETESISQLYLSRVLALYKDKDEDKSLQELFKYDKFLTPNFDLNQNIVNVLRKK